MKTSEWIIPCLTFFLLLLCSTPHSITCGILSTKCGLWQRQQGLSMAFGTEPKIEYSKSLGLPGFMIIHRTYRNTIRAVLYCFPVWLKTWHMWHFFLAKAKENRKWALTAFLHDTDMVEPELDSSIIQRGGDGERSDPFWNPYTLSLSITTAAWAILASQDHSGSTAQTMTHHCSWVTQVAFISMSLHKADPKSRSCNKHWKLSLHLVRPGQYQLNHLTVT